MAAKLRLRPHQRNRWRGNLAQCWTVLLKRTGKFNRFWGVGRLINKLEDKAITNVTGYDSDIDAKKWDYKRQDKKGEIVLQESVFKLVLMKNEE